MPFRNNLFKRTGKLRILRYRKDDDYHSDIEDIMEYHEVLQQEWVTKEGAVLWKSIPKTEYVTCNTSEDFGKEYRLCWENSLP